MPSFSNIRSAFSCGKSPPDLPQVNVKLLALQSIRNGRPMPDQMVLVMFEDQLATIIGQLVKLHRRSDAAGQ